MRFLTLARAAIQSLPMPLVAASLTGWVLLAGSSFASPLSSLCLSVSRIDQVVAAQVMAALSAADPTMLVGSWLTMLLAMMPPLLAGPLLHVWRRSFSTRRWRATALFILGYAVVWIGAGVVLAALAVVLGGIGPAASVTPLAVAVMLALLWQATPLKQTGLNRCHLQPPLAAFGLRADADVLRYGLRHGAWCVGACWALMLLPLVAGGQIHWPVMVAVTLASLLERSRAPQPARWGVAWPHRANAVRKLNGAAA